MKRILVLSLVLISGIAYGNTAGTYTIECTGETALWSERSNEVIRYKDTKVFKVVDGKLSGMACEVVGKSKGIVCLSHVANTNMPTVKSIKRIAEYNFETQKILLVSEGKVNAAEEIARYPELKNRVGHLEFVSNDSVFKGECKVR